MCKTLPYVTALVAIAGTWHTEGNIVRADGQAAKAESALIRVQGVVYGRVIDGAGDPVAGAKVSLYRHESPTGRWGRFKVACEPVTTDRAGTYRFQELADGFFMVSVENAAFARALRTVSIDGNEPQPVDIVLKPPESLVIVVEDQAGKPVVGAQVREITQRGVNGKLRLLQLWVRSLGMTIPSSDDAGRLQLPSLPAGDVVKVTIDHPSLAPIRTDELTVTRGATARATMRPGVTVTLRVPVDRSTRHITGTMVDLRHLDDSPSTFWYYEAQFDSTGKAQLTVEPGNYTWLLLQHEDYFLTPAYSANYARKTWLRIEPGRNQNLHFDVRRKVSARGRVVDAETGKPLRDMSVMGELARGMVQGWDDPPDEWSFAGWGESDEQGEYKIELAAGSARVSFHGSERLPEHDYYEISVAADGSTVIPDIKVRPLPKIIGVVQNPDGSPAVRAVVRLRGKYMTGLPPVLTNDAGSFEIQPDSIPLEEETGKRRIIQSVAAFDPYRPLAARTEVRLDKAENVVLKLMPHDPDWLLSAFSTELTEWERGLASPDRAVKYATISLRDHPSPELDAALWLNTSGQTLRLADLHGKFVLLDFWYIGCGPCHYDFPSVELLHEIYRDKGVVVIGVHNNSSTPEAVRDHVAKIKLPFPVAVDFPDGRTIARFEPHGIPDGYPDYVLISPEGKILLDDRTIPHPMLRSYKLEIIRKLLLESQAAAR